MDLRVDLRIEALFEDEIELTGSEPETAAPRTGLEPADCVHAEDAILAEYAAWLVAREASACDRQAGRELAREAFDLILDQDLPWQALPVERWIEAARSRAREDSGVQLVQLARAFIGCLSGHGRLSVHGERVLLRKLAAVRCTAPDPRRAPEPERPRPQPHAELAA